MKELTLDSDGFPVGTGIFETIKTIDGALIELNRHMRRAVQSAYDLEILLPDEESIRSEISRALRENPLKTGRLRICFGEDIFHISHDPYEEKEGPARLNFWGETVVGSVHKIFPYSARLSIVRRANDEGFDESILFNQSNEITETATANLILRLGSEWVTPPISSGILPGVVRAIAIEECGVKVRSIHVSEIPEVESAFIVSSLRIAQPISHIGEMKLKIGKVSHLLAEQIRTSLQPVSVG